MQTAAQPDDRRDSFEKLLASNLGIVHKVANAYGRLPEDRRDLVQEISVQLWTAFPKYDPLRSFTTWMYRIALNVAISHVRHAGLRQRTEISLDVPVVESIQAPHSEGRSDQIRSLMTFIERMDELNRALMLLYLEDRPYQEIGEIMGLTETNAATKISRLKQRIREELA